MVTDIQLEAVKVTKLGMFRLAPCFLYLLCSQERERKEKIHSSFFLFTATSLRGPMLMGSGQRALRGLHVPPLSCPGGRVTLGSPDGMVYIERQDGAD